MKPSVAVAMSSGVDSSVAAALLVEGGYQVAGFTMVLRNENDDVTGQDRPVSAAVDDAKSICKILGIQHHTVDLHTDFTRLVVEPFAREYLQGTTPNPCVRCNALIKWGLLWNYASRIGCERFATGHYAQVEIRENNSIRLLKGLDTHKEQSYFLWQIPKELLLKTMLPLGRFTKHEVRRMARRLDLPVADKGESQEVCFIPGNDYRLWIQNRHPELKNGRLSGEMVDSHGNRLGKHDGYHLFTIGQRKGLGLGGGKKWFVTAIDTETRRVQLGDEEQLANSEFRISNINCLSDDLFDDKVEKMVKIRYRDRGTSVLTVRIDKDQTIVTTKRPVNAVAPGQSAVFYNEDRVLGGGVIVKS